MGPTASGKTDLALELTECLPCDIVSVDSAMVYRGMDIGTAKPPSRILAQVPHRLVDICDPSEAYSAARFREDALAAMDEIGARGRIPLLVGGTMLYYRTLTRGLSRLPSADAGLRERLADEARRLGWPALHERLARVDPEAARRIHPNDPQRIQRALEVYEITGRPLSALQRTGADQADTGRFRYRPVVVAPGSRATLHAAIAERFQAMLERGLIDEVKGLRARGDLTAEMPSMRSVGYRQVWRYLEGASSREEMVEQAISATRQLAKRQMTWLRAETAAMWFDSDARPWRQVCEYLRSWTIEAMGRE
jgi:tRNA dimethylallyltransferase